MNLMLDDLRNTCDILEWITAIFFRFAICILVFVFIVFLSIDSKGLAYSRWNRDMFVVIFSFQGQHKLGRLVTSSFISQISRCNTMIAESLHNGTKKTQQMIMLKKRQISAYGMVSRYGKMCFTIM